MEQITGVLMATLFVIIFAIGLALNFFVDKTKVGGPRRRKILPYGPMIPKKLLTPRGVRIANVRDGLIVVWLGFLVIIGIILGLKQAG
jgi:hypothetical protein